MLNSKLRVREGVTFVSIQNILLITNIANNDLDILGLEFFVDKLLLFAACGGRRSQDCDAIKISSRRDYGSSDEAADVSCGAD